MDKYNQRGVSSAKEDVHAAIKNLDKGLFPNAFCKIYPDHLTGDPNYCNLVHADGAGTKTSLAYLYWKETGDLSVWRGIAQDSIVMNTDDLICVGSTGPFLFNSVINRNKKLIPGEVISEIIQGTNDFFKKMKEYDIELIHMGGETADVGDLVKTVVVDSTISVRMKRSEVIENHIQPGDVIVGFASFGQSIYEDTYNGGMGSNGLTSARHDVLHHSYAKKYPETFDNHIDDSLVYSGSKKIEDMIAGTNRNVGQLILSPTRTYAPLMNLILQKFRSQIHGIIHNSGGGQKKVMHFVQSLHIIKDNLFPLPPLFELIRAESQTSYSEMYSVFNMGHRLEIYCPENVSYKLMEIGKSFNIDSQIIGRVEKSDKNKLTIHSPSGPLVY